MQWMLWIVALIVSFGAGYLVYRADVKRAVTYPWLTAGLRTLVILLVFVLLLAPSIIIPKNETQKPVIVFLQDNSRSIAAALKGDTTTYRKSATDLIDKLKDKYRVVEWGFGAAVQTDSIFKFKQQSTDISAAFSRVQEFYGQQNLGAVILATDGRYNAGANPQFQELSLKGAVYTIGIGDSAVQKDIRVTQLYSNKTVSLNSSFEIRADIIAALCKGYNNNVLLTENGNSIATIPFSANTDRFDRSISFTVKAPTAGLHHYVVTVPSMDGEQNTANNRRDIFVEVIDEQKNILIAGAAPHPDLNAIHDALSGLESYHITVRSTNDLPADLSSYSLLILHNLPSTPATVNALQSLKKPMWIITGSQSNFQAISQLQDGTTLTMNRNMLQDALPAYNTSFSGFTLPQNIQSITDKLPPLSMPSGTIKTAPNAIILFNQRNNSMPLWWLQQGNHPVAITAGEGLWRWRLYEYRYFNQHTLVDECIRQTVSFLTANSNDKPFHVELPKYVWSDEEAISMNAFLLNANNEQVNTPDAQVTIEDSAGNKQSYNFERNGSSYRINIGIRAGGNYKWIAKTAYNGKTYSTAGSFTVQTIPLELMESGADYSMLFALAKKYNGSFFPAKQMSAVYDSIVKNTNITPVIETNSEALPIVDWKWFFFLILAVAVTEWLLRKYWLAQ